MPSNKRNKPCIMVNITKVNPVIVSLISTLDQLHTKLGSYKASEIASAVEFFENNSTMSNDTRDSIAEYINNPY
jgi:hypothetical protein